MRRDQFNQQHQNKDTFYRSSLVNDYCQKNVVLALILRKLEFIVIMLLLNIHKHMVKLFLHFHVHVPDI